MNEKCLWVDWNEYKILQIDTFKHLFYLYLYDEYISCIVATGVLILINWFLVLAFLLLFKCYHHIKRYELINYKLYEYIEHIFFYKYILFMVFCFLLNTIIISRDNLVTSIQGKYLYDSNYSKFCIGFKWSSNYWYLKENMRP